MADEKKEKWLSFLALTTVILAVCATLSTFKGGNFSTLSVMSQSKASDQWAYYQSKSIKGYIYEISEKLELELKALGQKVPKPLADEYGAKIDAYRKKIKKYDEEKAAIEKALRTTKGNRRSAAEILGISVRALQYKIKEYVIQD